MPLVLSDGRTVASWSHRFEGHRMVLWVTRFERGAPPPERYDGAFDDVGHLLDASTVEVVAGPA